jgi:hypothetical protein
MKTLILLIAALLFSSVHAAVLDSPTQEMRLDALASFAEGDKMAAQSELLDAMDEAEDIDDPYVQANEWRYIADTWHKIGAGGQATKAFAKSMEVALSIPTWNHRLYACIGVLEMQRATGDAKGTYANGMKALNGGLLEAVAATGEAAETGRLFAAMDGLLSAMEREQLKQRITSIAGKTGNDEFKRKGLHALQSIKVRAY